MTIHHNVTRTFSLLLLAALFVLADSAPLRGQVLMTGPLGNTAEPTMSLFILEMAPGRSAPSHSHEGVVFAYVLEGEIENQIEPEPPKIHRPGSFFQEQPKQVHRIFRNVSTTQPAKVLVFQNTATLPAGLKPLLEEKLTNLTDREVRLIKITTAPAGATAGAHQHPGPVFAYLLKGEVESQVDPDPAKVYRAGDVFYEAPMHAHRVYRNLSQTEPAELLVFTVQKTGEAFAMGVDQK